MFRFLSIRLRVLLFTTICFIGMASVVFIGSSSLQFNTEEVKKLQEIDYPSMSAAAMNEALLNQAAERFNLAVTIGDEELLELNQESLTSMLNSLTLIAKLNPFLNDQIQQIKTDLNRYFEIANKVAVGMIDEEISLQEAATYAKEVAARLTKTTTGFTDLSSARQTEFEMLVEELGKENMHSNQVMYWLGLIAMLLIILIGIQLARDIRKNLSKLASNMREIAQGNGDLTIRMTHANKDEISEVVKWFNFFIDKLNNNISSTIENINKIKEVSESLANASQATTTLSDKQTHSIESTTHSLEELFSSVNDIANTAHQASTSAFQASSEVEKTSNIVKNSMRDVEGLASEVNQASSVIAQLEKHIRDAGSILKSINAIAEQTNLLALNAAIEAARAGENGLGFAVVANEVRQLAANTQASTQEIQTVLEQLQKQSKKAVLLMSQSSEKAINCVQQSNIAADALQDVTLQVTQINEMNNAIASSTEEQNTTSLKIQSYVDEMKNMAKDASESVSNVENVSLEIGKITTNLSGITNQFRVE